MQVWLSKFWQDKSLDGSQFRAGIALILLSFPVSFSSPLVGASLSETSTAWFCIAASGAVYAFSWVLFLMGIWLGGRKGLSMAKELWHIIRRRIRKQ